MTDPNAFTTQEHGLRAPTAPPRPSRTRRGMRARIALVAAVIAAGAGGGYAIARCSSASPATTTGSPGRTPGHDRGPAVCSVQGGSGPSMSMGGTGSSMGFSSSSLAGTRPADAAPQTVSTSQARILGNRVPAGASVDKTANKIVFTGGSESFTVVAVPPGGPDMTFRVAGLTNPAIVISRAAQVSAEFINADPDEAHGWLVTDEQPPLSFGQPKVPSINGAYTGLIGDPTASGDGARTITFQAGPAGTYEYICPVPGHAQMGMHGAFIVH